MKPTTKTVFTTTALAALLLLAGCGDGTDGPAEQAGETVDEAAEETKEAMEEAGDKIENATE